MGLDTLDSKLSLYFFIYKYLLAPLEVPQYQLRAAEGMQEAYWVAP